MSATMKAPRRSLWVSLTTVSTNSARVWFRRTSLCAFFFMRIIKSRHCAKPRNWCKTPSFTSIHQCECRSHSCNSECCPPDLSFVNDQRSGYRLFSRGRHHVRTRRNNRRDFRDRLSWFDDRSGASFDDCRRWLRRGGGSRGFGWFIIQCP